MTQNVHGECYDQRLTHLPINRKGLLTIVIGVTLMATNCIAAQTDDPFLWLEDIHGKPSMDWVKQHNAQTVGLLTAQTDYQSTYDIFLAAMNSKDNIVYPRIFGEYIYNYWMDENYPKGLWRRTAKQGYIDGAPQWENLIDIGKLSQEEGENWDFTSVEGVFPDYSRFLVSLSRGGGDAKVIREYNPASKAFVKDGFSLPEGKGFACYLDLNTLLVAYNFGEGTMTTSGYPRQARLWKRGTEVKDAPVIHQADASDVMVWPRVINTVDRQYVFIIQRRTFFTQTAYAYEGGKLIKLAIPEDAAIQDALHGKLIIKLQSDWQTGNSTFRQGSIVGIDYTSLLGGKGQPELIVEPDARSSVAEVAATRDGLIVNMLKDVKSKLFVFAYNRKRWSRTQVPIPEFGTVRLRTCSIVNNDYFFYYSDFITPTSLYFANASQDGIRLLQSAPSLFDGNRYRTWQYQARSKDGTLVPYFVVGAKEMKLDGNNPTMLTAYGGFGGSMTPYYLSTYGPTWLDRGCVFVLGNIRGGGEFGPAWHQAGIKEKHQNVNDDFIAISEDLIARKITSPRHLGIVGGSGGALLVGAAFTQRPELFHAAVCMVPLLDMQRYNKLGAGASWVGEYGDPDNPEEWTYISKYSPYHNLNMDAKYPAVLFMTSTNDDRVHPAHARKMAAKMEAMGYNASFYETTEGGHSGTTSNDRIAAYQSLIQTFMLMNLK